MFTSQEKSEFNSWWLKCQEITWQKNNHHKSERELWLLENSCPVKDQINSIYLSGIGFKRIAKELGLSYTQARKLIIDYLGIETRKGFNVVTDELRRIRSNNVKGEKSPWFDWPNKRPELMKNSKRSIQGYYRKKSGEFIWLRSCWEYIYAKWLDAQNFDWGYETKTFTLPDGSKYRPDFFIKEDGKLCKIVEIKSSYFYENRDRKPKQLDLILDIPVITIHDVLRFTKNTYAMELRNWKKTRILKLEN